MNFLTKTVILLFFFLASLYLLYPSPPFPKQLPDSVQSLESADVESSMRHAYFTNYTRDEVVSYYRESLDTSVTGGINIPSLVLNYPPEDAYSLIRDQTRSTFLEEVVHPYRESLFINGFKPSVAKDDIWYKGVHYQQKITVRYVPSSPFIRLPLVLAGLLLFCFVFKDLIHGLKGLAREWLMSQ